MNDSVSATDTQARRLALSLIPLNSHGFRTRYQSGRHYQQPRNFESSREHMLVESAPRLALPAAVDPKHLFVRSSRRYGHVKMAIARSLSRRVTRDSRPRNGWLSLPPWSPVGSRKWSGRDEPPIGAAGEGGGEYQEPKESSQGEEVER